MRANRAINRITSKESPDKESPDKERTLKHLRNLLAQADRRAFCDAQTAALCVSEAHRLRVRAEKAENRLAELANTLLIGSTLSAIQMAERVCREREPGGRKHVSNTP